MRYVAALVLALSVVCWTAPSALADNSAQAHRVMVCSWAFEGHPYSIEMADLDLTMTAKEKAAFETVMLNDSMREMAGIYRHDFAADYPNAPATVHQADMVGWRCVWTER